MRAQCGIRIAAVLVALLLAGCGGSSKPSTSTPPASSSPQPGTFSASFKTVTGQFKQASVAIGHAIVTAKSKTNGQLAAIFGGLATRWSGVSGQLSALTPPASVSSQFAALRGAARRVSRDLVAVSAAAAKSDVAAARSATRSLVYDILAAKAAATRIDSNLGIQ